jgi:sulfide:quinone oxidoreductase
MTHRPGAPFRVLIAGGGPAALEGALELQRLAEDRVRITLIAPGSQFAHRPLAVAEPFGLGRVARFSLSRLAAERGFGYVQDAVAAVDVAGQRAHTANGDTIPFDALLIAVGARGDEALPGALTFHGSDDVPALRDRLERLPTGPRRIAFVAAPTTAWTLPLYELAVTTASWATDQDLTIETWLVTHEARVLGAFGEDVAVRVAELLENAGVRLWTGALARRVEGGRLWLDIEGGLPVDLAVALPRLVGPRIPGLPADEDGFIPVDAHGVVAGAPSVYAAGDVTTRRQRQGGLAWRQADVAATAIAVQAGAPVERDAYRPTLRGMLLTGRRPRSLSRAAGAPGEASDDAPWWPPHKAAERHLGPYLAGHPELGEPERVATAGLGR